MALDLQQIKNNLTPKDIIKIIQTFIPDLVYQEEDEFLLLPTICHHEHQEEGSLKLYYYYNTKLFFCYTQCEGSFDIYELVKKMLDLRGIGSSDFSVILNIITQYSKVFTLEKKFNYESIFLENKTSLQTYDFKTYDESILNMFHNYYYKNWIEEGISIQSMRKYNIKYYINQDQIIIPHYDINNNLIGIRARNLDPIQIEKGKYMPIIIEKNIYSHPLSYNLYGLNQTKEAIQKAKRAYVFEGEKSVLLCDTFYKENNISVATCGKKINKFQINLLIKLGVQEIVICYDRMNYDEKTTETYFQELYQIANKYRNYVNISFIFDRKNIIPYKSAPVDNGKEVFEQLLKRRVIT